MEPRIPGPMHGAIAGARVLEHGSNRAPPDPEIGF